MVFGISFVFYAEFSQTQLMVMIGIAIHGYRMGAETQGIIISVG